MRYAFIKQHQARFKIATLCGVLKVSRSGFYDWQSRASSARAQADVRLLAEIQRVHREHREAVGAFKTWRVLNREGIAGGKHRIARLRRLHGIEARRKRRFRRITEHHHTTPPAPDLIQRQFRVHAPNRAWVGDMTFVRTREGWLYLAVLLDLFSRRVIGWSMGTQPNQVLASAALEMALLQRRPPPGLVHHTDQGAVYAARAYRDRLEVAQALPSMGGKKSAYDNAVAESFFSNLKNELVHHCDFRQRDHARVAIFDYIEIFCNRQRRHQSLGYVSPLHFEER